MEIDFLVVVFPGEGEMRALIHGDDGERERENRERMSGSGLAGGLSEL